MKQEIISELTLKQRPETDGEHSNIKTSFKVRNVFLNVLYK